jgi:hypothetical protein
MREHTFSKRLTGDPEPVFGAVAPSAGAMPPEPLGIVTFWAAPSNLDGHLAIRPDRFEGALRHSGQCLAWPFRMRVAARPLSSMATLVRSAAIRSSGSSESRRPFDRPQVRPGRTDEFLT